MARRFTLREPPSVIFPWACSEAAQEEPTLSLAPVSSALPSLSSVVDDGSNRGTESFDPYVAFCVSAPPRFSSSSPVLLQHPLAEKDKECPSASQILRLRSLERRRRLFIHVFLNLLEAFLSAVHFALRPWINLERSNFSAFSAPLFGIHVSRLLRFRKQSQHGEIHQFFVLKSSVSCG